MISIYGKRMGSTMEILTALKMIYVKIIWLDSIKEGWMV